MTLSPDKSRRTLREGLRPVCATLLHLYLTDTLHGVAGLLGKLEPTLMCFRGQERESAHPVAYYVHAERPSAHE
jgi:hypothetical protein